MGIMFKGDMATDNTAAMVLSMILVGFGGSMFVVGSRVASEASVPHQDVALVISLLSLWSKVGSAIGSAIVVIWSSQMPKTTSHPFTLYCDGGRCEGIIRPGHFDKKL